MPDVLLDFGGGRGPHKEGVGPPALLHPPSKVGHGAGHGVRPPDAVPGVRRVGDTELEKLQKCLNRKGVRPPYAVPGVPCAGPLRAWPLIIIIIIIIIIKIIIRIIIIIIIIMRQDGPLWAWPGRVRLGACEL